MSMSTIFAALAALFLVPSGTAPGDNPLPAFGRDTVLVYKTQIQDSVKDFVIRIAEFAPDRYVEWEDSATQGTIFMPSTALDGAKGFVSSSLFEAGVDKKGKLVTTMWLSRRIFRQLKENRRIKVPIDSIDTWISLEAGETIPVEVNRKRVELPAIRTIDERKSERWFLDAEDNPLLLKHSVRFYTQTLASITTDKPNTLRWIKGKKLAHPPKG